MEQIIAAIIGAVVGGAVMAIVQEPLRDIARRINPFKGSGGSRPSNGSLPEHVARLIEQRARALEELARFDREIERARKLFGEESGDT